MLEGAKRPIIAILDTGVDITHPDLADNIWTNTAEAEGAEEEDDDQNGFVDDLHGWNFISNKPLITDYNGHGTHCAGIAAAIGNNGVGIIGANPNALIMPIIVMESDGAGTAATIIKGVDYAVDKGANILSMSFGSASPYGYSVFQKAYQTAILVAAAGNSGKSIYVKRSAQQSGLSYPGAFDIVLGVQASNAQNTQASFSNYDPDGPFFVNSQKYNDWLNYEIWAPGQNILSTYPGGNYKSMNGTSMATPLVAGAVSRLLQTKEPEYYRDVWIGDIVAAKAQDSIINMVDEYSGSEYSTSIFDAMAAYNFDYSNRKARLSISLVELDDAEGGDGDGKIDAGETIKLWPTLRSEWGLANNVKFSISTKPIEEDPTNIEIIENNVDFGYSLNRASLRSKNPLVIKVADKVTDAYKLKLRITATCDNIINDVVQDVEFKVENVDDRNGVIHEDLVLYPDKHYVVSKSIAIPEGVTLTIMPGTRVEFNDGCYIQSEGRLIANGKPDSLIVFTTRDGASSWGCIRSHWSENTYMLNDNEYLYTNTDTTLFTLLPTDLTPYKYDVSISTIRYLNYEYDGWMDLSLENYLENFHGELIDTSPNSGNPIWMNGREHLMEDPNFITPYVLQCIHDWQELSPEQSDIYPYPVWIDFHPCKHSKFFYCDHPVDTLSYCILENASFGGSQKKPYYRDCIFSKMKGEYCYGFDSESYSSECVRSNFINSAVRSYYGQGEPSATIKNCNYTNFLRSGQGANTSYGRYHSCNIIRSGSWEHEIWDNIQHEYIPQLAYVVGKNQGITIDHAEWPSWLGTSKEEIIRPWVYDSQNPNVDCFTTVDLSNMPSRPYKEAHGIVWKVVVDGYDAQDDFAEMPPLGVGRHKFEVYYNRDDMDTTFTPNITMGAYVPFTQIPISDGGYWSVKDEVSVYTAFVTVNGKLSADGLNRIVVSGAKDYDHFDVPIENTRFNVLIQAAGSMATGFAAEPGLGKVTLTWSNENNDFEDAMGFNVYRFQLDENNDTINKVRVNETIIDVEDTEYIDYEVTPGQCYYYYYKVLSTDLKEYDISNIVTATPLTSTLGDANASGFVDVADVITTVNYAAGMEPKPFIFEAADVNVDTEIDILDVIGIIKIIKNQYAPNTASVEAVAEYTLEDGIVYVDCPVDLAGVQLMLTANQDAEITAMSDLQGFEQVGAWMGENSYLFLAYNMNGRTLSAGRHAILNIGDAEITDIRLSDKDGHNVLAMPAVPTLIDRVTVDLVPALQGIYDMMGRKVANDASALPRLQPGIYIVNGKKMAVR